jgi:hypothetical protein
MSRSSPPHDQIAGSTMPERFYLPPTHKIRRKRAWHSRARSVVRAEFLAGVAGWFELEGGVFDVEVSDQAGLYRIQ